MDTDLEALRVVASGGSVDEATASALASRSWIGHNGARSFVTSEGLRALQAQRAARVAGVAPDLVGPGRLVRFILPEPHGERVALVVGGTDPAGIHLLVYAAGTLDAGLGSSLSGYPDAPMDSETHDAGRSFFVDGVAYHESKPFHWRWPKTVRVRAR